jgi:energy-coupling factor transporter transmembrane protein EcfT
MIAKMKCSNCGAEMSNLNMSWGKKRLWFIIPIMLLGFLLMAKLFWFKGEPTKELTITEVQKRTNGSALENVGPLTNNGTHTFSFGGCTLSATRSTTSTRFLFATCDCLALPV